MAAFASRVGAGMTDDRNGDLLPEAAEGVIAVRTDGRSGVEDACCYRLQNRASFRPNLEQSDPECLSRIRFERSHRARVRCR
jgi:hypothetical protein